MSDESDEEPEAANAAGEPASVTDGDGDGGRPERVYTEAELKAALDAQAEEQKDRQLRLAAEYDNFRRRVQREKEQWAQEAIERFATDLLAVLDDFERAISAAKDADDPVSLGNRLTEKQLRATLSRHGVEVIDPLGQKFDPKLHEAIQRVPPGDAAPGSVTAVFEKGYSLKGRLLRPARVQVAGDA